MAKRDIVVIGASAGGTEALTELVRGLPADFPAAIFVVVHFPASASSVLPRILSRAGSLPAVHPEDGDAFRPGRIYVARPDWHLMVRDGRLSVRKGPRENNSRPAIDPLFRSAARTAGQRVIGVVLRAIWTTALRASSASSSTGASPWCRLRKPRTTRGCREVPSTTCRSITSCRSSGCRPCWWN